jgi:chemotaxis family two-component system sensor kinase Cph1
MILSDIESTMVRCENEPIHIPGAIQPFGILLSVELPSLAITNASVNCGDAFGLDAKILVQHSLVEYLSAASLQKTQRYLQSADLIEQAPIIVPFINHATWLESEWELSAQYRDGILIVELEAVRSPETLATPLQRLIRNGVHAIFSGTSLQDLCDRIAQQVHIITGFDRVMIYRFNEDWHGHVVAEARKPYVQSYLDHHFPASDIPAQARSIFLENWLRMIPDVNYLPVPIYPGRNPKTGASLDLGLSSLRSVSPLHIEYLRNMHVGATLTLPLIDNGKLWGLIACHNVQPKNLASDSRLGTKMIAQFASSQLALKASNEDQRYRAEIKRAQTQLLGHMERETDLVQGLAKYRPGMLDLVDVTDAAAAIFYDNEWVLAGATPTVAQIEELVAWVAKTHGTDVPYTTNRLSDVFPPAKAYKEIASGLLAISILRSERNFILWFRSGTVSTITWAGEPEKRMEIDNGIIRLHPRLSFDSWEQIVDGIAAPWKRVEIDAISEIRTSIIALDLRRAFKREQAARELAEKLSTEKENMMHIVSHDIRNPLSALKMMLQLMQRSQMMKPETHADFIARGIRATETMERLVKSVLDIAKSNHAELLPEPQLEDANMMVADAVDLALPLGERADIRITASVHCEALRVFCKRARVEQILGNLISNALKFTAAGGHITVSTQKVDQEVVIAVVDTGMGIAPEFVPHIFERFKQGTVGAENGAGLGLAIVKEIVEQEGGRIWVESTVHVGTRFYFTLPLSRRQTVG